MSNNNFEEDGWYDNDPDDLKYEDHEIDPDEGRDLQKDGLIIQIGPNAIFRITNED